MMNQSFMSLLLRLGHAGFVCLVLGLLLGTSASTAAPDKRIDGLAKAYRAAQTELERRTVCLEAIDEGVIARDRSVTVVDAIFGTAYAKKLPTGTELETGVVHFADQPRAPRNNVQVPYVGWYLALKFDSTGRLQDYYLSNVHQK